MAKYLDRVSGVSTQKLAIASSVGAGDADKIIATDSTGKIDPSFIPGEGLITLTASEALSAGQFVNFWDNAGTASMRKADATTAGKEANGFVLAAVSSSAQGVAYTAGSNTQLSGLTLGAKYYLSTTPGGASASPGPSGAGNVSQFLGKAVSATELAFEPESNPVTLV